MGCYSCGSCKNRRFGGAYRLHHQGEKICELGTTLARCNSVIIFDLMMEAISSSGTSVLTRAPRRHIPEDDILLSHLHKNL
jgi:hypothetical protein